MDATGLDGSGGDAPSSTVSLYVRRSWSLSCERTLSMISSRAFSISRLCLHSSKCEACVTIRTCFTRAMKQHRIQLESVQLCTRTVHKSRTELNAPRESSGSGGEQLLRTQHELVGGDGLVVGQVAQHRVAHLVEQRLDARVEHVVELLAELLELVELLRRALQVCKKKRLSCNCVCMS